MKKKERASKAGSRIATVCAYVGFSALFSLSGIAVAMHWDSETLTVYMLLFSTVAVWGLWRSVPLRKIGRKFFAPVKTKKVRKKENEIKRRTV